MRSGLACHMGTRARYFAIASARLIPSGRRNNTISAIMVAPSVFVRSGSLPLLSQRRNVIKAEGAMSLLGHRQKFPKPKDMSAPPSEAEIGGVTDAQAARTYRARLRAALIKPEMSRRRAMASAEYRPCLNAAPTS